DRPLRIRKIHCRLGGAGQALPMYVSHNADDLPRARLGPFRSHGLPDPDALADRVLVWPEHPCHRPIDDHDGSTACVIGPGEPTATEERDAHSLEKLRTDSATIRVKCFARRRRPGTPFNRKQKVPSLLER